MIPTQIMMFESDERKKSKYSSGVQAPIYEPKNKPPHELELLDPSKTLSLLREIEASDVPEPVKKFLRSAAHRHTVFDYEKMADYYAHAAPEIQELMESSALVIIDFNKAIQAGFVRLSEDIRSQYLEEYPDAES